MVKEGMGLGVDAGRFAGSIAGTIAAGAVRQLAYGGKANYASIAADAFGNALGNSFVDGQVAKENSEQIEKLRAGQEEAAGPRGIDIGGAAMVALNTDADPREEVRYVAGGDNGGVSGDVAGARRISLASGGSGFYTKLPYDEAKANARFLAALADPHALRIDEGNSVVPDRTPDDFSGGSVLQMKGKALASNAQSTPEPIADSAEPDSYTRAIRNTTVLKDTGKAIYNLGLGLLEAVPNLASGSLPGFPGYEPFLDKYRASYDDPQVGEAAELFGGIALAGRAGMRSAVGKTEAPTLGQIESPVVAQSTASRQAVADAAYKATGWSDEKIASHLAGIDFSQPIETMTLPKGTQVVQFQLPGNPTGNYFAPMGTSAESLGINPTGRIANTFTTTSDVSVLKSTAASTVSNSNLPISVRGVGGGVQYFSPDISVFVR